MSVYKKLNPSDVSIKTFKLYKLKQFSNSTLSSLGVQEKYARLRTINTSSEDTISAKNTVDLNENNVNHIQLNHLYYRNQYYTFGNIDLWNPKENYLEKQILLGSLVHYMGMG